MGNIEKVAAGMGALIALYLVVFNGDKSNQVLQGLGSFTTGTVKALQGR